MPASDSEAPFWLPLRFPFSVATGRDDPYSRMLFVIICPACERVRSITPSSEGIIYGPQAEICPGCGVTSIPLPIE